MGALAGPWVTWNHPLDTFGELRFLCITFVVLLIIPNRLPHVFPGKMQLPHVGSRLRAHRGDPRALRTLASLSSAMKTYVTKKKC